jgi:hypothetical protein
MGTDVDVDAWLLRSRWNYHHRTRLDHHLPYRLLHHPLHNSRRSLFVDDSLPASQEEQRK